MSITGAQARIDDAVFQRFGEDATYVTRFGQRIEGVRVVRKRPDETVRFADSQLITPTCALRVRKADVDVVDAGDSIIFTDGGIEIEYVLHGDGKLNARRTVWTVGGEEVDVSR